MNLNLFAASEDKINLITRRRNQLICADKKEIKTQQSSISLTSSDCFEHFLENPQ